MRPSFAASSVSTQEETELQAWLLGQETPPPTADRDLLDRIIEHKISTTPP